MAKAVISTIGHDRPGLISDITAVATRLELNIEDSRMTALGGEFAILMSLEGAPEVLDQLDAALSELCAGDDIAYIFRPAGGRGEQAPARPYVANVVALDHPGIVHAIAEFFSSRGINIRDLNTETAPAAHTGTPIFNVSLVAEIPSTIRVRDLKAAFEAFCDAEDLDGDLHAER